MLQPASAMQLIIAPIHDMVCFPIPAILVLVKAADKTQTIASLNVNVTTGGIYTLFLAGQSTSPDTVLAKETIPGFVDSSCGVRFINLSYNSRPITVSLNTTPTTQDFTSISYKNYSSFKIYSANAAKETCTFQVRNAATSTLHGTYTLTVQNSLMVRLPGSARPAEPAR